jgi:ABC-type multidrug transport system ATPase subunit
VNPDHPEPEPIKMYALDCAAIWKTFQSGNLFGGLDTTKISRGVRNVSLHVPHRSVYAFVGPNGAGKTTMMRLILGLLRPDSGTVRIYGNEIATDRRKALASVGALIEAPGLYRHLSGKANLDVTSALLGLPKSETDRVLELVQLRDAAHHKVGSYSLGMKQRLALARSLLGKPRLLMLDEPTNGLDPDGIIELRSLIRSLPEQIDGTVFVSSHLLTEVEAVADHIGVMRNGRLVAEGPISEIIGNKSVMSIETDRPGDAADILRAAGFTANCIEGHVIVACDQGQFRRNTAASVNRCLVEHGLAVSALYQRRVTLEDAYLSSFQARERQGSVQ